MTEEPNVQKQKLDNIPFIQMLYSLISSTDNLEKAWSKSLDKDDTSKAHTELLTLWESFRQNFPIWTEDQSLKLRELGFDTIIKRYPLNEEDFQALAEPSSPIDRYNQLSIASLYQIQGLLRALTAIKEPSHEEITSEWNLLQTIKQKEFVGQRTTRYEKSR
ncbi:MAG TPA: hypothetical protein VN207_04010 [Ktedonobacteraceae bacterium]|nr:hypothetical protein [Ktedonobacteraceae bacterium]